MQDLGWRPAAAKPRTELLKLGGLLVGVVLVVGGAVGAIMLASPTTPVASQPPDASAVVTDTGHEISVRKLEIGDCFDFKEPRAESIDVVIAIPCTDAHRFELFHIALLPEGDYPTLEWIETSSRTICQPVLETYTGLDHDETALEVSWIYPNDEAWLADDRLVQCFALHTTGKLLTASIKGPPTAAEATPDSSASDATAAEATDAPVTGPVHVRDLRPGDCWATASWEPDDLGNVTRTNCGLRHQFEVVWTGTYAGNTYPSSEGEMLVYIDTQCSPAFEDYVGVPWDGSPYEVWWTYPTAERWLEGDHSLVCSAFDIDGPIDYSVKDVMRP